VDEPAEERLRVLVDDLLLPRLEHDRAIVLRPGACCGNTARQAWWYDVTPTERSVRER
jgi:hypothetical protein